jgi:hypothetical protein
MSVLAIQFFRSRRDLFLENQVPWQQLSILRQSRPQARFAASDRLFWVIAAALAGMEAGADPCSARNHCAMASSRIQSI